MKACREKLPSETNTQRVEDEVIGDAIGVLGLPRCELSADFEHGQWWVTHLPSGAQWSVVDTSSGFDFEQVTDGDADC